MKFSGHEVPETLFELARRTIRARTSFTPEDIRHTLVYDGKVAMCGLSGIEKNHWIVANRVMRAVVRELVAVGEIRALRRGEWMKASVLDAAVAQEAFNASKAR